MMEKNRNLFLKTMDDDTKMLLQRFQEQVIMAHLHKHGNLKGYGRQIYLLLPKYDRRRKLFRGISRDTYEKLNDYLRFQSQRYWRQQRDNNNVVQHIRYFREADHRYLCYERVWHDGITAHGDSVHSASQLVALREGVSKYGFTYYENDYNFTSEQYVQFKRWARADLVNYYRKILAQKLGKSNGQQ